MSTSLCGFADDVIRVMSVFDKARLDPDRGKKTAQELEDSVVELETLITRLGLLGES